MKETSRELLLLLTFLLWQVSTADHYDVRCKCVCPNVGIINLNTTSPSTEERRVYIRNVAPRSDSASKTRQDVTLFVAATATVRTLSSPAWRTSTWRGCLRPSVLAVCADMSRGTLSSSKLLSGKADKKNPKISKTFYIELQFLRK